jgi:hypothetical protein
LLYGSPPSVHLLSLSLFRSQRHTSGCRARTKDTQQRDSRKQSYCVTNPIRSNKNNNPLRT